MIQETLNLFNRAIPTKQNVDFKVINEFALKAGYLIHQDLCNKEVLKWITSKTINHNATFYKKWYDIISKDRFQLYIDQLKHYASTYGTNHEGIVYMPKGTINLPEISNVKVGQRTDYADDEKLHG